MRHAALVVALWLGSSSVALCHTLQVTGMTIRVDASGTSVSVVTHSPMLDSEEPAAALARRVKLRLGGVPFQPQQVWLSRDSRFDTVTWNVRTSASAASVSVDAPVFPGRPEDTTIMLVYRNGEAPAQLIQQRLVRASDPKNVLGAIYS